MRSIDLEEETKTLGYKTSSNMGKHPSSIGNGSVRRTDHPTSSHTRQKMNEKIRANTNKTDDQ